MKKYILIVGIIISLISCDKDNEITKKYPGCLQSYIDSVLTKEPSNPPAKIDKYQYNEQIVYYHAVYYDIPQGSNDIPESIAVNDKCEELCLFGGIAGSTCIDWGSAKFIETVWEDNR